MMGNSRLVEEIMAAARDWAEQSFADGDCVIGGATANTDSPIEASLLVAMGFTFRLLGDQLVIKKKGDDIGLFYELLADPYTTLIIPQYSIKSFRVDFALFNRAEPSVKIAVECDGHKFHEKTKEQAQRDKARDRFLQVEGFKVLRFTGSEIYRRPLECAAEVRDAVMSAVDDFWISRG